MLADALEMCLFFTPARRKPREVEGAFVDSVSGMALLARGSWLTMDALSLPCDPSDGERVAQVGTVAIRGRVIRVANLHLTHLRDADDLRERQLDAILRACDDRSSPVATLLCGDFNTTVGGAVLGRLVEGDTPRLIDAWSAGGGSLERGTIVSRGPCGPCVDHVFGLVHEETPPPAFWASKLVLDARGSRGILPSDHFGVMTDLLHTTGACP